MKRLRNYPFALIGVNSDRDREEIKIKNLQEQITWRSFWNGAQGTRGPISTSWEVRAWPTLYLIDHKGVLRRKFEGNPGDAELDRLIDELVVKAMRNR
ncbi:MAG: hypothetical protein JNJ77_09330 [Planctomycetia bacterium]|nr:hypothetical protein [Planctomycetia bacterium]